MGLLDIQFAQSFSQTGVTMNRINRICCSFLQRENHQPPPTAFQPSVSSINLPSKVSFAQLAATIPHCPPIRIRARIGGSRNGCSLTGSVKRAYIAFGHFWGLAVWLPWGQELFEKVGRRDLHEVKRIFVRYGGKVRV